MNYVWGYLAFFGFNAIVACVVYVWSPTYRHYLVAEDSLVENLSAALYLLSFFLALLFLKERKNHRRLLVLVAAAGLLGFLDEISFGGRIFGFSPLQMSGVPIDAIHDLFALAYRKYSPLLVGISVVLLIASVGYWSKLTATARSIIRQPHSLLFLFSVASIAVALVIDLPLINYGPFVMLEELLEMHAAVALCLCCFSLPKPVFCS